MIGHPFLSFTDAGGVAPTPPAAPTGAGAGKNGRRWWFVDGLRYFATLGELEEILDSVVAVEEVVTPVKTKRVKSKGKVPEVSEAEIQLPDLPVVRYDWRPLYRTSVVRNDPELTRALEAAVRRFMRERDEMDDEDVILLMH